MHAIGTASRLSGVGIETIRFYERSGVIPRPARAANGRRLYTDAEIARLRFLKKCRDLGFSLAEARALRELSENAGADCAGAAALARAHRDKVRARIAELQRLDAALGELMQNCADGNAACPLLHAIANA
ncbi:MAG: MerR family transcriptional regulator [Alphaproteobacteria bacterium]|nr:MAG: MerR family transcriptional regulator [Alphaproteobacteria bacterium]